MGSIWLSDLESVLRNAGGPFPILTKPGWQTRSRSTGGYDSVNGIVVHHDAAGPSSDGWPSVNYQCDSDPDRPNAALYTSRKGEVFIMAAGACNTQGLGGPILGVPANQGNQRLIGIEQGNNGIGEPYTAVQQDCILWLCRTLVGVYGPRFGWGAGNVISHREWAGPRKCDPGGPSRWTGGVAGCGAAKLWDMDRFRSDIAVQPIPPPPGDDFMSPEDRAYLDAKFAAVLQGALLPPLEGYGADTAESRVNYTAVKTANTVIPALADIRAKVTAITTGQIDPVVLAAAIKAALATALADPATLAAVAKAVNEDAAKRLAT